VGYLHIENSYRENIWLQFLKDHPRVYALEKIDGTSADVKFKLNHEGKWTVSYFSGGSSHNVFVEIFNQNLLLQNIAKPCIHLQGVKEVIVYGEAYGGKVQGLSHRYGKDLRFVAFDVRIKKNDDTCIWLNVLEAAEFVANLELDFVWYKEVDLTVVSLDTEMYKPSVQSAKLGMGEHRSEGIVVRPLIETEDRQGNRLIMKHKHPDERERKTKVEPSMDPEKLAILTEAQAIADEWVVQKRLEHVLGKLTFEDDTSPKNIPLVIKAMLEDVKREAEGEIVWNKDTEKAIQTATARLYQNHIRTLTQGPQK
jgi:hypothetical protein